MVGRVANRIENATFALNGTVYPLTANNGLNTLHGGTDGFHARLWTATQVNHGVKLELTSPDGDQGFPGTLQVTGCGCCARFSGELSLSLSRLPRVAAAVCKAGVLC